MAYEELFQKVGAEYDLNWRLLAHQAWYESRFNPFAVGAAGDMGLMQILPATWDEFAPKVNAFDPFDPESSIRVAASILVYLRDYLIKLGRPEIQWMFLAYNWGVGNVQRLLKGGGDWSQAPVERQNYATGIVLAAETDTLAELLGAKKPVYG